MTSKYTKYIGKKFGSLTPRSFCHHNGRLCFQCECECGGWHPVTPYHLIVATNKTRRCAACRDREGIQAGGRYGSLVVVERSTERGSDGRAAYLCRCDCGRDKVVLCSNLTAKGPGATRSCGCQRFVKRRVHVTARNHV